MSRPATQGTWGVRAAIRLFTIVLGVLIFWLLGFLVEDIESIPGPDYAQLERQRVDGALLDKQKQIAQQIEELDREIKSKAEQQRLVGDSSENLQRTMNQLTELQKLRLEKEGAPSEAERADLSASLTRFLDSQKTYQTLNQEIAEQSSRKVALDSEDRQLAQQIEAQRQPAKAEYDRQSEAHRLRLALYELLVLVPLLVVAGLLLLRRGTSLYSPLFLAAGGAILVKIGLVMHEYFPSRYFKYILILALLGVVIRLLVQLIRSVAFPRVEALRKQYREAYERFLCPICDYPIRTGPRKFLYWTRRTVHNSLAGGGASGAAEPYSCPACGTALFELCGACHQVRHSLLAYCERCGAEKPMALPSLARDAS